MLKLTCEQFRTYCQEFRAQRQNIPAKSLKDKFERFIVLKKENLATKLIQKQISIVEGSRLQPLDQHTQEKVVIEYDNYVANEEDWKPLARQSKLSSLKNDLRREEETIKELKEIQDAINTYKIIVKFYPFLTIVQEAEIAQDKYQNFLIVYLIFGLRAISIVKRYEKHLRSGDRYLQSWRNEYMSRKVQRYYSEAKKIYQGLQNKQDDFLFLFQFIKKDLLDADYVESLCILYNILHSLNEDRSIGFAPFYKEHFLILLEDNIQPIEEEENKQEVFKVQKLDEWNQMQQYRMIETTKEDVDMEVVEYISQCFENHVQIKSFSRKQFLLHINPLFRDKLLAMEAPKKKSLGPIGPKKQKRKVSEGPIHDNLDKLFFRREANLFKENWTGDHQKFFYCDDHNIACIIACQSKEDLLHIGKKFLSNNVLWMRASKTSFNVEYKSSTISKKWNTMKVYYISLYRQDVGSKYASSYYQQEFDHHINLEEHEEACEKIFKKILGLVRDTKKNKPLKEYTNSFQLIYKTERVFSEVNQLRGLQKTIVIQNYCNIFFKILEEPQIKCTNPLPLMFCILLQALKISHNYLKSRSDHTQKLRREIKKVYNRIKRFVGFGFKKSDFQSLKLIQSSKDLSKLLQDQKVKYHDQKERKILNETKDLFAQGFIRVDSFHNVGIFWPYIEFAYNISTKTILSREKINNTVKNILSRMLTECALFYYTNEDQDENGAFAYYKKTTLDLEIYFMALTYGMSIKRQILSETSMSEGQKDILVRPVTILARELKERIKQISCHPIKTTKFIDIKAQIQKLEEQLNNMYVYNIPYTNKNLQQWKYEWKQHTSSMYQRFSCKDCNICEDLSHIFKGQDCFSRFQYLIDLLPYKIDTNSYTKQYEQIMDKLYGKQSLNII